MVIIEVHISTAKMAMLLVPDVARHTTLASSLCPQLCVVSNVQSKRDCSVPTHCTLSKLIGPVPRPK